MTTSSKYATAPVWFEPCCFCVYDQRLTWLRMYPAAWEVQGPYCDGCMGWPTCSCDQRHVGSCYPESNVTPSELWAALANGDTTDGGVLLRDGYAKWRDRIAP